MTEDHNTEQSHIHYKSMSTYRKSETLRVTGHVTRIVKTCPNYMRNTSVLQQGNPNVRQVHVFIVPSLIICHSKACM